MLNRTEVKKRMEELNMTQQTLADAIGVSQPMVTHILIGRKQPSLALAADIAARCDVFYIGGTKVGALFGEAVVFTNPDLGDAFFTEIKQHGALLAKGRLLGIQFDELFTNNLYTNIADHAVKLAMRIKRELTAKGYRFYNNSYTNQQFPIISKKTIDAIAEDVVLDDWGPFGDGDDDMRIARITTSWATTDEAVDTLLSLL